MKECKCKQCAVYDDCKVLYKGEFTCRCFGTTKSDVLLEEIILRASHGDDECHVDRDRLEAFRKMVREETKAELALSLAAQENSIKTVLESVFNSGHNDDCIFCGLKDAIVKKALHQWGLNGA